MNNIFTKKKKRNKAAIIQRIHLEVYNKDSFKQVDIEMF